MLTETKIWKQSEYPLRYYALYFTYLTNNDMQSPFVAWAFSQQCGWDPWLSWERNRQTETGRERIRVTLWCSLGRGSHKVPRSFKRKENRLHLAMRVAGYKSTCGNGKSSLSIFEKYNLPHQQQWKTHILKITFVKFL